MNHADMAREAARIVPPANATAAIAVVDEQLHHRAAFLIGGRIRSAPVGPAFDKPRDAIAFVDILNGETDRAPRTPADDFAGPRGLASEDARLASEAPDSASVQSARPRLPDGGGRRTPHHPNPTVASQAASG